MSAREVDAWSLPGSRRRGVRSGRGPQRRAQWTRCPGPSRCLRWCRCPCLCRRPYGSPSRSPGRRGPRFPARPHPRPPPDPHQVRPRDRRARLGRLARSACGDHPDRPCRRDRPGRRVLEPVVAGPARSGPRIREMCHPNPRGCGAVARPSMWRPRSARRPGSSPVPSEWLSSIGRHGRRWARHGPAWRGSRERTLAPGDPPRGEDRAPSSPWPAARGRGPGGGVHEGGGGRRSLRLGWAREGPRHR